MTATATADGTRARKFPTFSLLACLAGIAAVLALLYPPVREHIDSLEYWTADWRTALLADRVPAKHEGVVLVLFDPETFDGGVVSPIPRDTHAQVLRAIDDMQPAAIGLDFYFVAGQSPERDQVFLETLRDAKSPIVLGAIDEHTDEFSERQRAYQQRFLAEIGRAAGYLALKYDTGHIVRRTSPPLAQSHYKESFARQVVLASGAQSGGAGASSASTRVAWVLGPGSDTQPFLMVSAKDLLPGAGAARLEELRRRVKGRIVITGIDMPNQDRHDTALSVWTGEKMLGVLVHAHIIAQLVDNRYYFELAREQKWGLLLTVGVVGLALGWAVRGKPAALLNLTVATIVLVAADAACYYFLRIVLPFTLVLYVWFIGVLLGEHLRTLSWWAVGRRPQPAAA